MDKSKMMMFIIIALLVILLGTVVGVGVYLINIAERDGVETYSSSREVIITPANMRTISLGEIITNLYPGPNDRSDNVRVEIIVGLDESSPEKKVQLEEFDAVFNRQLNVARAIAIEVFVSRTYDEVRTLEGRRETAEIIKNELQKAFNNPDDPKSTNFIVDVAFSDIIVMRGG
ncbi:MAG: flagellar basal body-associated FliL family protein [Defluviitaleaceae bacterium]|nr:flagellar basal body-associated FliL family protein [Defluviitaleaceae bacterium]